MLLLLVLTSCGTGRDEELPVRPPFIRASVWYASLYVQLTPGTRLDSVVLVDLAPLRAGMTVSQASAVTSGPSSTRVDDYGTYYAFGPEALHLELAHLQYGGSEPVDKWVITAKPKDDTINTLLSSDLRALITRAGGIGELTIHEHKRPDLQAFSAKLQAGRLKDLQWYSIEGFPGG